MSAGVFPRLVWPNATSVQIRRAARERVFMVYLELARVLKKHSNVALQRQAIPFPLLSLPKIQSDMREQHSFRSNPRRSCPELLAFVCFSLYKLLIKASTCYSEDYLPSLYDGAHSNRLVLCCSQIAMMQSPNLRERND